MSTESIAAGKTGRFSYTQTTSFQDIRNQTVASGASEVDQSSSETSFFVSMGGTPGRGGMVYRVPGGTGHTMFCIQFDCSSITSKPVSASLRLHAAGNGSAQNIASNHKFVLAKGSSNFINAAEGTTPPGNTVVGTGPIEEYDGHTTNSTAYSLTEYATFDPTDLTTSGDVLSITLSDQALDDLASQDAFVLFILDKTYQADNNDPFTSAPSAGAQTFIIIDITVGGTGANVPRLIVETSLFSNAENESGALVGGDFTINTFSSAVLGAQFAQTGEQVPFSLGTPGARHLRGRLTAYATEKGEKISDKEGRGKKGKSKT